MEPDSAWPWSGIPCVITAAPSMSKVMHEGRPLSCCFQSLEAQLPPPADGKDWKDYYGQGETILVIDDEPRQREIAFRLLTSLNYAVHTVASGKRRLNMSDSTPLHSILDMLMPPGLNGRMTFEKILKILPGKKQLSPAVLPKMMRSRPPWRWAPRHLSKPYTLEHIGSIVYQILINNLVCNCGGTHEAQKFTCYFSFDPCNNLVYPPDGFGQRHHQLDGSGCTAIFYSRR